MLYIQPLFYSLMGVSERVRVWWSRVSGWILYTSTPLWEFPDLQEADANSWRWRHSSTPLWEFPPSQKWTAWWSLIKTIFYSLMGVSLIPKPRSNCQKCKWSSTPLWEFPGSCAIWDFLKLIFKSLYEVNQNIRNFFRVLCIDVLMIRSWLYISAPTNPRKE